MTKIITVSSSVDSSAKLQTLINSTGNVPTEFIFSKENEIEVSSPIRFYPAVKVSMAAFALRDNVSTSVFPSMTPILGSKYYGGAGFEFKNLTFDGNSGSQSTLLGKGFHNFIGLSGASNISISDCYIHDSMGDGARLTNVKDVNFNKNTVIRCGHDAFYVDKGSDIEVYNNYVELRTNSGCRLRHTVNGHVYNNKIINKVSGKAACPGMQIENSTSGMISRNILIENNEISDTWGPGIWVIGTNNSNVSAASGLTIQNNLFSNCGNMDSSYHHLPGVGGIVSTGWNSLDVSYNTFDRCKGYGVLLGSYYSSAAGTGYNAKIFRNIFTNTRKSNTIGTASGAPIAKLDPKYTNVSVLENCFYNNVSAPYGVSSVDSILQDPEYVSATDDHLQLTSPCRFDDYQLGRYGGSEPTKERLIELLIECGSSDVEKITNELTQDYEVFEKRE